MSIYNKKCLTRNNFNNIKLSIWGKYNLNTKFKSTTKHKKKKIKIYTNRIC